MIQQFAADRNTFPRSLVYQCPACGQPLPELPETCPGCGAVLENLPAFTYRPPATRAVKIIAVLIIVLIILGSLMMFATALFPADSTAR